MCVSMAPAEFTGAIVFAGEVDRDTHILAYQNKAKSLAGPNCMLLHVPAYTLWPDNLVPTQGTSDFMKGMSMVVPELRPSVGTLGGPMRGTDALIGSRGFDVVEYGAYEVVLASSAGNIREALSHVSEAKRPAINQELLDWYDTYFPDFSFILACFNSQVEVADHPIMITYQPQDSNWLFAPGLESHSGKPPTMGARDHERDFKVVFGSRLSLDGDGRTWFYGRDNLGMATDLLPNEVVGFRDENIGTNSDYVVDTEHVRLGVTGRKLFSTMPEHFYDSILDRSQYIC